MAVVVDADGRISSPLAMGADAVLALARGDYVSEPGFGGRDGHRATTRAEIEVPPKQGTAFMRS
jgi:hypothetical protein